MLNKEAIRNRKTPPEEVTLESTGETVYIRHMTGMERVRLIKTLSGDQLDPVLGVMLFLSNEDGTRMFDDNERAEVEALDGLIFQDVYLAGCDVNGLSDKAENDAEKNSEAAAT